MRTRNAGDLWRHARGFKVAFDSLTRTYELRLFSEFRIPKFVSFRRPNGWFVAGMRTNSNCHGPDALQATVIACLFHMATSLGPRRFWHLPCYLVVSRAVFFHLGPLDGPFYKGENIC